MKAIFGSIVTDGRGKLGGHVYSKNRYGSYKKTKVTPLNNHTVYKDAVKAKHKLITQTWGTLSEADRKTWIAGTSNFPQKNTFGEKYLLSGFGLFVKLNLNRLTLSQTILNVCPLVSNFCYIQSANLSYLLDSNSLILDYYPPVPPQFFYKIYATPLLSPGINYSNRKFKLIGIFSNSTLSPIDIISFYSARYQVSNIIGKKIFIKITPVETATGVECQHYIFPTIIYNSTDMLSSSINFSSAELLANTSKVIIPAPGASKVIIPIAAIGKYYFNTIAFTGNGKIEPRYSGSTQTTNFFPTTTLNSAFSISRVFPSNSAVGFCGTINSPMENTAIVVDVTGTIANGNGSMSITFYYLIDNY